MNDDMAEFLRVKGVSVSDDNRAHFTVRQNCLQYDWDTRKCKIWPTRPKICQQFPLHFAQLIEMVDGKKTKMCSYDWDLNTDTEIGIDLIRMTEVLGIE